MELVFKKRKANLRTHFLKKLGRIMNSLGRHMHVMCATAKEDRRTLKIPFVFFFF